MISLHDSGLCFVKSACLVMCCIQKKKEKKKEEENSGQSSAGLGQTYRPIQMVLFFLLMEILTTSAGSNTFKLRTKLILPCSECMRVEANTVR